MHKRGAAVLIPARIGPSVQSARLLPGERKYMLRLRYSTLCLAVACCAGLIATASAGAAEAETRYYVEGAEVATPETFDAVVGPVQVNTEIGGVKQIVECASNSYSGSLEAEGAVTSTLTLKDCSLYEVSKGVKSASADCTVAVSQQTTTRTILVTMADATVLTTTIGATMTLGSRAGTTCMLAAEYKIAGTAIGVFSPEGTVEGTEHLLTYTSQGSKLTITGQPAPSMTLTISRIKLLSGKKWRAG
jgi:hypothetical protein